MQALVDAVIVGGGSSHACGAAVGVTGGNTGAGSSSGLHLQRLAERAALAQAKVAAAAGSAQEGVPVELQALRLEARDAAEALLQRCRDVAALRRSLLKKDGGLGQLAEAGQDGAPRPLPLLRQVVGEGGSGSRPLGWHSVPVPCIAAVRAGRLSQARVPARHQQI